MPPQILAFFQNMPGFGLIVNGWLFVKVVFILADVLLLILFVTAFYKGWKMRPHIEIHADGHGDGHGGGGHGEKKPVVTLKKDVVRRHWQTVQERAAEGAPDSLKIAVLEADKTVADVLEMLKVPGEHTADRLTAFDAREVKSIEGVWRAHRLRNDLVHTPGFTVGDEEARTAIASYEAFLKEIDAL